MLQMSLEIEGLVVGADGFPATRVRVKANPMPGLAGNNRSTRTGNDGRYKLTGMSPGDYKLTFSAPGRFAMFVLHNVGAGSGGVNVRLDEGLSISGIVTDYLGYAVQGVPVMAQPLKGGSTVSAGSNHEGKFVIKGLTEGKHRLRVGHNKAGWVLLKSVDTETGKKDVKIVVEEGLSITGVVVDNTGKGIANAYVQISRGGSGWTRTATDGSFTLVGLKPGDVQIRVYANPGGSATVDARAGEHGVQIQYP